MTDQFLHDLLGRMTTDEKVAQLMQLATPFFKGASNSGEITGPMVNMNVTDETVENTGSVLGAWGAKEIKAIQERHLQENRLGIPLLMMADVIHGYRTIFPVPLAIGSSWDLELAEKSAQIAAKEAAVSGIHVTFAPMVDLVRDPRWGRVMESTGEDPYLNGAFARVQVEGFQGDDLKNNTDTLASCVKHFAAYGAAEGGRDYNTVNMSERDLREYYLPAYKAALEAGSEMVMTAFNTVDGIPATGNKTLMRDLLREEWGFDGVLISDWGAVKELIPHGVAANEKEAAEKAIKAGLDIEMMTTTYASHLKELIEEEKVDASLLDEAVLRVLELKQKLGLFENPYRGADEEREKEVIRCDEHRQTAQDLAAKSAVLLKNDNVLPLKKEQKIALIGPFAEGNDILGPWSFLGSTDDAITVKAGIEQKLNKEVIAAKGSDIETGEDDDLQKAIKLAGEAEVVVLALGEASEMSGEAGSRTNIQLPAPQLKLVEEIVKIGKPTVAVLFNGRPLDLHGVIDKTDAVLEAWFPGTEGGAAIADLLYGEVNPSGKLTMSFPDNVGQVPVYYNHFNTGRPKGAPDAQIRYVSQYLDSPNAPMFPFGYGLSYTTYAYDQFSLSRETLKKGETLTAQVNVSNTGKVAGEEIVQLYIQDKVGEIVRPLKELKGFEKIHLEPGETKTVQFTITEEQLRYHHADLSYTSDPGEFVVFVGPNSAEVEAQSFELE
ncbi:Periplasmic beta-glucosidase precursor [Oceanobacillus picturae]|uniref:beta-glucosidase n=1 Tax=Oceanobacillus picturae TaxID=171693 RepID=W9BBH7_9BACI|nr:glycoside hydrolase family 3 N-terminal domain-containing protein [Oceanobacillus picturae]CDO03765.1 Periplasmic beta-glucosidase precursor [Oceanobacillus picturae]